MLDMEPQARHVAALLDGVSDSGLAASTPCESYAVRDLLSHLLGLTVAFRDAAKKNLGPTTTVDTAAPMPPLPEDWAALLRRQLDELADAWRSEAAWEGETQVGGVTLPGAAAGGFGLNELVLHGWDLARATGQSYTGDPGSVRASITLLSELSAPEARGGIFGPVVELPADAPLLDRAVALGGRRPDWTPALP